MGALEPQPHSTGALVLVQVELVPAAALGVDLDANLAHLVGPLHSDALTGRVTSGVVQVEGAAHAVLGADTVAGVHPAGLLKDPAANSASVSHFISSLDQGRPSPTEKAGVP